MAPAYASQRSWGSTWATSTFREASRGSAFDSRAEIAKRGRAGDVFLPDALKPKLVRFWRHKVAEHERLAPSAPLFCSCTGRRLSKRRVQVLFRAMQIEVGFDRLYPFHALRHTAITNVYRASRDLFLAQRFARHASPLTTVC